MFYKKIIKEKRKRAVNIIDTITRERPKTKGRSEIMKRTEFIILCNLHGVAPEIALENENMQQALADKNDEKICLIFCTEF